MYEPIPNTGLTSMARGLGSPKFMHSLVLGDLQEEPTMDSTIRLADCHMIKGALYIVPSTL